MAVSFHYRMRTTRNRSSRMAAPEPECRLTFAGDSHALDHRALHALAGRVCRASRGVPHRGRCQRPALSGVPALASVPWSCPADGAGVSWCRLSMDSTTGWTPSSKAGFPEHGMAKRLVSRVCRPHGDGGVRGRPAGAARHGLRNAHGGDVRRGVVVAVPSPAHSRCGAGAGLSGAAHHERHGGDGPRDHQVCSAGRGVRRTVSAGGSEVCRVGAAAQFVKWRRDQHRKW